MAEIALRTSKRDCQKKKYRGLRPKGAVMIPCSDRLIRKKWLEICCDLVSPKKRDSYKGIPGWQTLCDAWTPDLRDEWLTYYDMSPHLVWNAIITPLGIEKDMPLAPDSDVCICDTWLWSEAERKRYFIVTNIDAPDAMVEAWGGNDERRDEKDNLVIISKRVVAYETDIGLSGDTLSAIAEPGTVVNPRFDKPVSCAKFVVPDLASVLAEVIS